MIPAAKHAQTQYLLSKLSVPSNKPFSFTSQRVDWRALHGVDLDVLVRSQSQVLRLLDAVACEGMQATAHCLCHLPCSPDCLIACPTKSMTASSHTQACSPTKISA